MLKKKSYVLVCAFLSVMYLVSMSCVAFDTDSLARLQRELGSYASSAPYFSLEPVENTSWHNNGNNSGFKFFCDGSVSLKVNDISLNPTDNGDYGFGGISLFVKFDPDIITNIGGTCNNSNSAFNDTCDASQTAPSLFGIYGTTVGGGSHATTLGQLNFRPNTGAVNKLWFDICDKYGNNCTSTPYTAGSIADGTWYKVFGKNINSLGSVKGAVYNLYAWPCTPDTNAPTISSTISNKVYTGVQTLTGLIYDKSSTNLWDYWFNGHTYSETGVNYVQYGNSSQTKKMDNQQGIDSSTINVSISCSDCGWSQATQSLTTTKSANAGTTDRNAKTWNNNDRGYMVSFTTPELKLERPTTVTMTGCDLPNETGAIHCTSKQFTFNKTTKPTITGMYNTNGVEWRTDNVFPSRTNEYMITVSDNPAGINPSSITITFDESIDLSGNTTPTYVLSGNVLSGGALSITESGTLTPYGVRTLYEVRFNPLHDLLEGTQTKMTVYVEDYVGNTGSKVFNLTTRGACSSFGGCRDYLNINHFSELDVTKLFSGLTIVVTGTDINSIYPYLTGNSLFCGSPWTGTILNSGGVMNLYIFGSGDLQDELLLTKPAKHIYVARNSEDLTYSLSGSNGLVEIINVK